MPNASAATSVVKKVVNALRGRIFALPDGALLGSEEAIMSELGVSRPSFRQAAKLLEQEQILSIKRGVGGGYFARRPSISAVAHTAAVFLHSRQATLAHVIAASKPLFVETARLAATQIKASSHPDLEAFASRERTVLRGDFDIPEFLQSERQFWRLLAPLSGNPVLELFLMVVFDFAATMTRDTIYEGVKRIRSYRLLRSRLVEALLEGDAEIAETLARRCNELLTGWMEERTKGAGGDRFLAIDPANGRTVPQPPPAAEPAQPATAAPARPSKTAPGRRGAARAAAG